MAAGGFFTQALVYLTAAILGVLVAKRIGLGSVLGYLLAGVAIGPAVLGFVGAEGSDVMHFAEFGVVLMLFLIGLELQPSLLWRMRSAILGLGGLQVVVSTVAIAAIGMAWGLAWQVALAVGLSLSLSSTAIVLQTLQEKKLMRTDAGQSAFAVLLFQDVAVIPMLALFPLLATLPRHVEEGHAPGDAGWVSTLPPWGETLVVLGAVSAIVLVGRFLVRPFLRAIARTRVRELFIAAALLLVVGIALLMDSVGLSPALGTFLAGVVLANSEYRHALESDIEPFKGLLLGLFFISVGASIDFRMIAQQPGTVAGLVALLIAVKWLVLLLLGRLFRMGLDQNLLFAFALAQAGEFAFVLFAFAIQDGVVPVDVASLSIAVVAISMATTPLLLLFYERIVRPRVGTRESAPRRADEVVEVNPVIIAGFGDFGNIVGRLLRANGIGTTVLEDDSDRVELLRRLGFKVFYGDASRLELLQAAGAAEAKLLVIALDDLQRTHQMVKSVKQEFPHLRILVRAQGRVDAYELLESGVERVYRQTLDSSLTLGVDALRMLGFRAVQAHRAAATFRQHDENDLRELASMRHDRPAYLSRARQLIAQLEELLQSEVRDSGPVDDSAWDAESLRREFSEKSA
ncbi:MAG: cation:proton antiporter [Candidatus Latescibacterota bacterium]|nr:MAG: cation:proton antiporter [Candidatus Latescibacterota bacterium]